MKLSVIVLTKNEATMLQACLASIRSLADEIIIIDDESIDQTTQIAQNYTDKIFVHHLDDFSSQREFALQQAQGEWILYLDADERVTPALKEEIRQVINQNRSTSNITAYFLKRKNIFLGKEQAPDQAEKLFLRKKLLGWFGAIHETPKIEGEKAVLNSYLLHLTHRDLDSMTLKTLAWSRAEADLLFQARHPRLTWWRLMKVMFAKFYQQIFVARVYRYGLEGWIEGLFQVFSLYVTYIRLWEKQRGETLKETYQKIDQDFLKKLS